MSAVDPIFAQWLMAEANYTVRVDVDALGRWGTTALTTERVTGIATRADAADEADRQLEFFSHGPFALDEHQLPGTDWQSCIGLVVTLTVDQLGYEAGVDVIVIEATPDMSTGLSQVTVVRPLRGLS